MESLDIWQLKAMHKRIMAKKVKEMKGQALAFAQAQAGMGGVKFSGISNANDFWHNEILAAQETSKQFGDKVANEKDISQLLNMLGER